MSVCTEIQSTVQRRFTRKPQTSISSTSRKPCTSVLNLVAVDPVDVEISHWFSDSFDLLVALQEKSSYYHSY